MEGIVFDWVENQTQPETTLFNMLEYVANFLGEWGFLGLMIFLLAFTLKIPNDRMMQLVAGGVCIGLTLLHFDAAFWLDIFPSSPAEIVVHLTVAIGAPIALYNMTCSAWKPRIAKIIKQ